MNLRQRKMFIADVKALAKKWGVMTVEIESHRKYDNITLGFGSVRLNFETAQRGEAHMLGHWHQAQRDLRMNFHFDSINTCHYRKATSCATTEGFLRWLDRACEAARKGYIFADYKEIV